MHGDVRIDFLDVFIKCSWIFPYRVNICKMQICHDQWLYPPLHFPAVRTFLCKPLSTIFAFEWLFACVDALVVNQVRSSGCNISTYVATIARWYASVDCVYGCDALVPLAVRIRHCVTQSTPLNNLAHSFGSREE